MAYCIFYVCDIKIYLFIPLQEQIWGGVLELQPPTPPPPNHSEQVYVTVCMAYYSLDAGA